AARARSGRANLSALLAAGGGADGLAPAPNMPTPSASPRLGRPNRISRPTDIVHPLVPRALAAAHSSVFHTDDDLRSVRYADWIDLARSVADFQVTRNDVLRVRTSSRQ